MQYLRAANIVVGHANFPAATTVCDDIIRLIHVCASTAVDPGRCLHHRPPGGQKPWCPLPLKSAEVRFNPPRWWCVPLQLARIEGPSGAACDLGAARPTVRTGSLTQIRIDGGQNALARRSTRAIKHLRPGQRALSEGNLRRQRTHGHHGQNSRPLTGGAPWFTTNRRRPWHVLRVIDSEPETRAMTLSMRGRSPLTGASANCLAEGTRRRRVAMMYRYDGAGYRRPGADEPAEAGLLGTDQPHGHRAAPIDPHRPHSRGRTHPAPQLLRRAPADGRVGRGGSTVPTAASGGMC